MQTPLLDGIEKTSFRMLPVATGLLGAGVGAVADSEDRLRGAAIGAGSGLLLGFLKKRAIPVKAPPVAEAASKPGAEFMSKAKGRVSGWWSRVRDAIKKGPIQRTSTGSLA